MVTATRSTAIGSFESRAAAECALQELRRAGFGPKQVGFVTRDVQVQEPAEREVRAETGAAAGAVTGGVVGALLGVVAALSIPAVGPVIAAGLLAGILGGGAAGAWGGGMIGALVGLALPEEEARYYEEELREGRTLIIVQAGERYTEAMDILSRRGGTYMEPYLAPPM
jgi:hypothetical protein